MANTEFKHALKLIEKLCRALGLADDDAQEVNRQLLQEAEDFLAKHGTALGSE
jgi:hypothetical protein